VGSGVLGGGVSGLAGRNEAVSVIRRVPPRLTGPSLIFKWWRGCRVLCCGLPQALFRSEGRRMLVNSLRLLRQVHNPPSTVVVGVQGQCSRCVFTENTDSSAQTAGGERIPKSAALPDGILWSSSNRCNRSRPSFNVAAAARMAVR
jgi:hypothetical protein